MVSIATQVLRTLDEIFANVVYDRFPRSKYASLPRSKVVCLMSELVSHTLYVLDVDEEYLIESIPYEVMCKTFRGGITWEIIVEFYAYLQTFSQVVGFDGYHVDAREDLGEMICEWIVDQGGWDDFLRTMRES